MRALAGIAVTLGLLIPTSPAQADDFDTQAQAAVRVRVDDLVWALTATCEGGDDVQQRQCRLVRDRRVQALAGVTLLVDGDPAALELGTWSPQRKSMPIVVTSCIRCTGVEVDGTTWLVAGAGAAPRFDKGKLRTAVLVESSRQFKDAAAATAWTTAVRGARVEYLAKLPAAAKRRWRAGGKDGLALEIVGYRASTPCDGVVLAANPPSAKAEPDPQACAPKAKPAP